ncbi:unnamed protein product [Laminaria digitata]
MPFAGKNAQLFTAIKKRDLDAAKAALGAGAKVNGSPGEPYAPIVAATVANHAGIVDVLLEQGADPDRPVTIKVSFPSSKVVSATPGERALHMAARSGYVEIVRSLLKRSRGRADPNVTDNIGLTPLMATLESSQTCVEVVRLLLEAGADLTSVNEDGFLPLHAVAVNDEMGVVDMLHSGAPTTLNRCDGRGRTPLFFACHGGYEGMVSKLLSLGAMQRTPLARNGMCPLSVAVGKGFVGVVRVLLNKGGIKAVGGEMALPPALCVAARFGEAKTLRLLLAVDGEEKRSKWANIRLGERHLIHFAAGCCRPTVVSVLLRAGADEAARDGEGRTPLDFVGMDLSGRDWIPPDRGEEVAIRRMLQRGPAYRARSWAWPLDAKGAGVRGSGYGDTAATPASAAAAVLSSPPALKTPPIAGVRICRPKEKSSNSKFFVRLIGRYCAKE